MRNLVFVNDAFFGGGAEKSMRILIDNLPKKNGVYYASLDKETNIYLRFYENDTAVTTSSMNNVKKAATYIAKELGDKLMRGKYFINPSSCNIRVKAKKQFGKVKMDGIISGDKLVMAVINLDDRTASDFVFNFYPIAKP